MKKLFKTTNISTSIKFFVFTVCSNRLNIDRKDAVTVFTLSNAEKVAQEETQL